MAATNKRQRATFLLEMALDAERVKERIASQLRAERARRALRQEDMAHLTGVSTRTYSRLENAKTTPHLADIAEIGRRLGINLLAATEEEDPPAQNGRTLVAVPSDVGERYTRLGERLDRIEAGLAAIQRDFAAFSRESGMALDLLAEGVGELRANARRAS